MSDRKAIVTDMGLPERDIAAVVDHGGSIARARKLFPQAPEPWIDLSTGINPHSYPLFDLPATTLTRLPEPARMRELAAVAAKTYGAPSNRHVAPAPGTQILLPRVYSLVKPGRALILGPTYAEHARAAALCGHDAAETGDFAALTDADLAVVVNPNNPDGRALPRAKLLALADKLHRKGGLLVVDEAFMDVGPRQESLCGDVGKGGIVVLRSFGKFFGLAGVRLGFAIASEDVVRRLDAEFGPWAVSGPAVEYGIRALDDVAWQETMRARLQGDAARLDGLFERFGVRVDGGTSLFRHIALPDAQDLFEALGNRGILLRSFADRPQALRAGLPGCEEDWRRLDAALSVWADERGGRATAVRAGGSR
jgi:cobalamin biosynthetic protein CobC